MKFKNYESRPLTDEEFKKILSDKKKENRAGRRNK